jgi:uncharacterized protein
MSVDPDADLPEDLLRPLERDACARLLAASLYGRLAFVEAGQPKIIVLNHVVSAGAVLFRTRDDALLAELTEDGAAVAVAYETDSAFPAGRTGWSVIATGSLVRETDQRRIELARTSIGAWAEGDRDVVLRLDVEDLTGRRVGRL